MTFQEAREISNKVSSEELDTAEALLLFSCVQETSQYATIIEIGTSYGNTAVLMAMAGRHVITIDNYSRRKIYHTGAKFEGVCKVLKEYNITVLKAKSQEMYDKFSNIDLLFIDEDHGYKAVKTDIDNWLPRINKGGKMIFHDYGSWQGVTGAVNEAIRDGLLEKVEQSESLIVCQKPL